MLLKLIRYARNEYNKAVSVRSRVKLEKNVSIGPSCFITAPDRLVIESHVSIGRNCWIACNGIIGRGSLISSYVGFVGRYDHDQTAIGRPIRHAPWIYEKGIESNDQKNSIQVGEDVWIGYGATICSGVSIGRGAVVGSRAVVTKDVAAYAIVVGNPARQIGSRFDPEVARKHEHEIDLWYERLES